MLLRAAASSSVLSFNFFSIFDKLSNGYLIKELNAVQGRPVDIGGYYHGDKTLIAEAMRPSTTLNEILAGA